MESRDDDGMKKKGEWIMKRMGRRGEREATNERMIEAVKIRKEKKGNSERHI